MALSILGLLGEDLCSLMTSAIKPFDGSFIAIQTNKGAYVAGETIQGYVVLQNNSPRQINSVVINFSVLEATRWDEEQVITRTEGEGDHRKTHTEYRHFVHSGEMIHVKERIIVSNIATILQPGSYMYPFNYTLRADLPGSARFSRNVPARDPARRIPLGTFCEVAWRMEAYIDVNGMFNADMNSRQELSVQPAFDWVKSQPQYAEKVGSVLLCCCIPRGQVLLKSSFDRAAYTAGETAGIRASIKNDSEQDVRKMDVKLVRTISMKGNRGERKTFSDTMCSRSYEGVALHQEGNRDLPLPLCTNQGPLLPGTRGNLVDISYQFVVGCDLACAPDIEINLPMVIFSPQPTSYGLAAMGLAVPQGMTFTFQPSAPPPGGYAPAPSFAPQQQKPYAPQQQPYAPQQQPYAPQQSYQQSP